MRNKSYIAILLVSVFLVKFIAIDADALSVFFSDNETTFINKFCKKRNLMNPLNDSTELSQLDDFGVQLVDMNGYCTSQFNFDTFLWETKQSKPITVFNEYFLSSLSYLYLEKVSPPPRLA